MASVPPPPANFGQRLLPSVVDDTATATPSRILYSVPRSRDIADGFIDITAQDFARAVDRCAWHLEESLGPANPGAFPTLLYMGAQDVVYAVVILACIKTGYKVLLSSPRNTLEAHLSLLEQTACNSFLVPPNFPLPVVKQILAARKMTTVEIPGIQHWLDTSAPHRPYPYTKTYAAARLDPWVVLHTSGSTGLPKPIVQTHATYSPLDSFTSLPSLGLPPTYPALCAGKRVYLAFPLFHCAGVMMLLPASILGGFTVVLGLFPPSPDAVDAVHLHGNVQESCLPPSTLVDLARNPAQLENLRRLHHVTYGGGPLPTAVGDLISTRTTLLNVLGTTEAGVLPHQVCSSAEDWSYMQVSPALGAEYREVSEGLYEQVIVRKPELAAYQGVFGTFPDLHEWPMKDLYKKHPTREGLWLYSGRIDDVIVFSTGEKLNPVDMESSIESHPAVSAALISGNGQFQAALLVETKGAATEAEEREILDDIWPSVQAANKVAPSHGIIHRDMILLTRPDKPMLRAGKGTVQRRMTLELYAAELEALYQANAPAQAGGDNQTLGAGSCKSIQEAVLHIVSTSTGLDLAQYSHDTDLFELGMDSLQVTAITKDFSQLLSSELGRSFALEPRNIYSHPSMRGLVDLVTALAKGEVINETTDGGTANLEKLYQNLATLVSERPAQPRGRNDSHAVLLTGSTGSLGSYVLESLAQSSQVHRIYCLNRGLDSLGRQEASQAAKGLSPLSPKVKCLDADLSKPFFGLSKAVYKELLKEVTLVIQYVLTIKKLAVLISIPSTSSLTSLKLPPRFFKDSDRLSTLLSPIPARSLFIYLLANTYIATHGKSTSTSPLHPLQTRSPPSPA